MELSKSISEALFAATGFTLYEFSVEQDLLVAIRSGARFAFGDSQWTRICSDEFAAGQDLLVPIRSGAGFALMNLQRNLIRVASGC